MATAHSAVNRIKFKQHKKIPAHRLPFVGREPGREDFSFWAVPASGNYGGACETGNALAKIYLKHLREHGREGGGFLQKIVLDMLGTDRGDSPEQIARRGQVVGFCAVLEAWLEGAALSLSGGLDELDEKALLKEANAGLSPDYEPEWRRCAD